MQRVDLRMALSNKFHVCTGGKQLYTINVFRCTVCACVVLLRARVEFYVLKNSFALSTGSGEMAVDARLNVSS